jgi:ribosomal protein S18 acetylase RimI-like enzyme
MIDSDDPTSRGIREGGLLVCHEGDELVGAMLSLPAAGRVTMAWQPKAAAGMGPSAEREVWRSLLDRCTESARQRGSRFIQFLADELSPLLDETLRDAGYLHLTQLVYARRSIDPLESMPISPPDVEFVPYADSLQRDLFSIMEQSYRQSLDCPELTGVRTMEDVFASHQGHGTFDPRRWFLVRRQNKWIGCLLLSAGDGDKVIEISYVALLTEARGQGLGRVLTRQAIRRAQDEGFEAVVLAVDGRNTPALAMYEDEGFTPWDIREVFWRVLDPADCRSV